MKLRKWPTEGTQLMYLEYHARMRRPCGDAVRVFFSCKLHAMRVLRLYRLLFLLLVAAPACWASAYNGHPKLIVVIVIDQFRGDYLERYREQFGDGGFRLFLDHCAYFSNCNYDYANTRTAPRHA